MLTDLTAGGPRIIGSPQAAAAVKWGKAKMEELGLQNVRLQPCMVPHWVRGDREEAFAETTDGKKTALSVTALGLSVGTPAEGITANVLEVHSLAEVDEKARGKIVFYNGPMDPGYVLPFDAYRAAGDQRNEGAKPAGKFGAVAFLVRSLTFALDDIPHTGHTGYDEGRPRIPGAAISTLGANKLSELLKKDPNLKVHLRLGCRQLPDVESANVVGEIIGSEKPDEIILVGAHLDSWDKGTGAHDDGAGVTHVLEVARLLKSLDLKPKRTVRFVLFMSEEAGQSGGEVYAATVKPGEKHVASIESDAGGFPPVGFGLDAPAGTFEKALRWASLLAPIEAERIREEDSGSDLEPLMKSTGVPVFELLTDNQRYFDYHHSDKDTIDKVHPRELELGAIAMATYAYVFAQEGL